MRRNTLQREIVYQAVEALFHASSEQIIEYVNQRYQGISVGTIYRNLNVLIDEKRIRKLKLDNSVDVYETIKANHYHFQCEVCHRIIDIPEELVSIDYQKIESIEQHQIISKEISFYGICHDCQTKSLKEEK